MRRALNLGLTTCLIVLLSASAGVLVGKSRAEAGGVNPAGSAAKPAGAAKAGRGKRSGKRVKPRAKVRFKLSDRHLNLGQRVRLHGRARPGGRRPFRVVVKGPDGEVVQRRTNRKGQFRHGWAPSRPGVYRLRAYSGANRKSRGSIGPARRLTVYRPAHASWYGPGFYGNRTACGQTLTSGMLGVAHKTLPCGTKVKLRYKGRRVSVRVIDRGPFIPGRDFDLTYATKSRLGFGDLGTVYVSR